MRREVGHHRERHVRQRTHRQRDLLGDEAVDERRVLETADAVVDPADAEVVEGLAHVLGRALLAGVRDGEEALGPGAVEHGPEVDRRVPGLRRVEPDRDDVVAVRERGLERRHRRVGAEVAEEAEDQPAR